MLPPSRVLSTPTLLACLVRSGSCRVTDRLVGFVCRKEVSMSLLCRLPLRRAPRSRCPALELTDSVQMWTACSMENCRQRPPVILPLVTTCHSPRPPPRATTTNFHPVTDTARHVLVHVRRSHRQDGEL